MTVLAAAAAVIAGLGLLQAMLGCTLVRRFCNQPRAATEAPPPVTVLKPLYGAEPKLADGLASLFEDACSYGGLIQIVLGVQDADDPALQIVRALRDQYAQLDIAVVVDPTPHGRNRKVANLINMLRAASHDTLVIADSDIHAPSGYIAALVTALQKPGVGLATSVYTGLPANTSMAARLGATGLTHGLLPGALMARALGRQDCFGATMAIRRTTLEQIGGLAALSPHLADDHVLGELVRAKGLRVAIATIVPATTVAETGLSALYEHELRWARTIVAIVPVRFALSTVQFPLVWAGMAIVLSGGAQWTLAVFLASWAGRALTSRSIDRALASMRTDMASSAPIWLLPLRDLLSFTVALAGYFGNEVVWRGHVMRSARMSHRTALSPPRLGTEPR